MGYSIEILSVGEDLYSGIRSAADILNAVQDEFRYELPPDRLRNEGIPMKRREYHASEIFAFLLDYCKTAGGHRPFLIAVVNGALRSDHLANLFGSRESFDDPRREFAVVTVREHDRYVKSRQDFLCYYFIRYGLSFVAPEVRAHADSNGCFFDKKLDKRDIVKSLRSGDICDDCRKKLQRHLNPEIDNAIEKMVAALKKSQENADVSVSFAPNNCTTDDGFCSVSRGKLMKDFFISYNGKDKRWAEWIAWTLEEAGFETVIQAWDFRPGGDFVMEMQKAATGTRRTIAVLSDNYLRAEYTQPEWGNAFARDPQGKQRALVPVRVAQCKPDGLLATRIYIDLVGLSADEAREKLIDSLQDRGKPATSPVFPGSVHERSTEPATEHAPKSFPGRASSAVVVWQEKLEFLRAQEPLIVAPDQKFALMKQIEEAERRIRELSVNP